MPLYNSDLKRVRQRRYLGKDFDGLRAQLLDYARLYYPDRLKDFSEESVGGLFLDFAAYVGDSLSFYLDHQFSELDPTTAVENTNIENALNAAGVPIVGAAPSVVPVTMYVKIPAQTVNNVTGPMMSAVPVILAGSIFSADNGTLFTLNENVDFNARGSDNVLLAGIRGVQPLLNGTPTAYIMARSGLCVSGRETSENVIIDSEFVPFREITLTNADVTDVISVYDSLGNTYYEVSSLTNDVVYTSVLNTADDKNTVQDALRVIPAPYRFTTKTDIAARRTTLIFGGGTADTLADDVIPDPTEFALPLPYKRTFSRISVNPNQLIQTKTLGVASTNSTLTINYRHGGGLSHNVDKDNVQTVTSLKMQFPGNPTPGVAGGVRSSVEVTNQLAARGGDDAPTVDDLKILIPSIRNSQERMVTRPDVLARIYTLPSNFGRVFRASIRSNPNNPLATQLFIVSKDADGKLVSSPDTLKQNIVKYLNPYRQISDAIDVLDARVINLSLTFEVLVDPRLNKSVVLQSILTKLQSFFDIKNFSIDQPIIIGEVDTLIKSSTGVISVNKIVFNSITGNVKNREYSNLTFDVGSNTRQQIIFTPPGGIFEMRYPDIDIIARASV